DFARDFERLEVDTHRGALAMQLQPLLVDRLEAEEHVLHSKRPPVLEDLRIAAEQVGASFEVVLLFDFALFDFMADREAMLGMNERNVVDDEDVGLLDRQHVFRGGFGRGLAITAAVKSPRTAERTIPRASASELDRRARIERADKIFVTLAAEIAGRKKLIEIVEHHRRRSGTLRGHDAGNFADRAAVSNRIEEHRRRGLALATNNRVDIAARMRKEFMGEDRAAMASGEDEASLAKPLHVGGEIDHFGYVGEIVQREADRFGPKGLEFRKQVAMLENLKVEYPDLMASRAHGGGYAFHPERFEAQVDFAVHERTGMYE